MSKEGYTSGELSTIIRFGIDIVPEENNIIGIEYSGHWCRDTKTII